MARLMNCGFELNSISSLAASLNLERIQDGARPSSAPPTVQTSVVRSGTYAAQCDTLSSANHISTVKTSTSSITALTNYIRCYFCFRDLPTLDTAVTFWNGSLNVFLTTTGKLQLWYGTPTTAQIGSDSDVTIVADSATWYRIELMVVCDGSGIITAIELRLDGSTVASASGLSGVTGAGITPEWGLGAGGFSAGGNNLRCYLDDIAFNESSGASQNTWPGEGKILMLLPISDNARTGFTGGAGGTASLFEAVNNTPPVGVADTGTDVSQIRDAVSSATDNYDANLQSYISAGIPWYGVVNVVHWVVSHGTASATSPPARAVQLVSNPAESAETTLTAPTAAVGTWPTTWISQRGSFIYPSSSIALGSSPVLRIGKRTASTRVVDCCFLGLYVDYTAETTPCFPPVHLPFMR